MPTVSASAVREALSDIPCDLLAVVEIAQAVETILTDEVATVYFSVNLARCSQRMRALLGLTQEDADAILSNAQCKANERIDRVRATAEFARIVYGITYSVS